MRSLSLPRLPLTLLVILGACSGPSSAPDAGSGTVSLPGDLVAAEVLNASGAAPVEARRFSILAPASGPLLTLALDADGAPLLAGWIGAGQGEISPRTTAEVLAFFAAGGHTAPPGLQATLQRALADVAALDPLADAIEAALIEDPKVFEGGSPALAAAIGSAARQLFDHRGAGSIRSLRRGLLINPANERSGLRLDAVSGVNDVQFTNRYRRPAFAFVDRVSTFAEGVETASPKVIARVAIEPVKGLEGGLGTIAQILSAAVEPGGFFESQNVAYVPRRSAPIALPNVPGASKTRYRVAVVGPGLNIGDHHDLTAQERAKQTEVFLEFLVRDFLLPFLAQIVVPAADLETRLDSDIAGDVVQDLIGVLSEGAPGIAEKAAAGQVDAAVAELWDVTVGQGWVRDAILAIVIDAFWEASGEAAAARATQVATRFIAVSGALDSALTAFDLSAIGRAVSLANIADVWTVDARDAKVVLTPTESEIRVGEFVTLEAKVVDAGPDAVFEYRFSTPGHHGQLQGEFARGPTVTSSSQFVTYDAQAAGTESVRVEVLENDGTATRQPVGETTATITVVESAVEISPGHADVEAGATVTLSAAVSGAGLDLPLTYRWSTAAELGGFAEGRGAVEHVRDAPADQVDYRADPDAGGTETIQLEVSDARGRSLGTDTAFVAVGCDAQPRVAQLLWRESRGVAGCAGCEYYQGQALFFFDEIDGARAYVMGVRRGESIFENLVEGKEITLFQPTGQASRYYFDLDRAQRHLDRAFVAAISEHLRPGRLMYVGPSISVLVHPDTPADLMRWHTNVAYVTDGLAAFDLTLAAVCE